MAPELMKINQKQILPKLDLNYDHYPYRVFSTGTKAGLSLSLSIYERDVDFICSRHQDFKIYLHTPGETIIPKNFLSLSLMSDGLISVKPQIMTTSSEVRSYALHKRKCFFDSEHQLYFFQVYTQRNCQLECRANIVKSICGCV